MSALRERIPASDEKVVFFTSERFHEAFKDHGDNLPNSRYFVGSSVYLDAILDRHIFYQFIRSRGLAEVPRTIPGDLDPWLAFGDQFCIRMKRTWDDLEKLTGRVRLVTSRQRLHQIQLSYRKSGLTPADWCYQEVLSTLPQHNVSVCGWHDRDRQTYLTTRHVVKHPDAFGNGVVTEAIEPPAELHRTTRSVLDALDYEGPFELEFILSQKTGRFTVIELNPRFWMQHGLAEALTGHELVRRYVGHRVKMTGDGSNKRYWVNTVRALYRLSRGDRRILPYLRDQRSILVPSYRLAIGRFGQCLTNAFQGLVTRSSREGISS
jgi:hypothetical protein